MHSSRHYVESMRALISELGNNDSLVFDADVSVPVRPNPGLQNSFRVREGGPFASSGTQDRAVDGSAKPLLRYLRSNLFVFRRFRDTQSADLTGRHRCRPQLAPDSPASQAFAFLFDAFRTSRQRSGYLLLDDSSHGSPTLSFTSDSPCSSFGLPKQPVFRLAVRFLRSACVYFDMRHSGSATLKF
jgi:hypothetical protein